MTRQFLSVSLAALLVAGGLTAAQAQQDQGGPGTMMQQDRQVDRPNGRQARDDGQRRSGRHGMRGRGYRHGMAHRGMHGMRGMRGHHRMMRGQMMRTMIILMDTDGDGALSLEEVQSVTDRFFSAMDADSDGNLTIEEIRGFYMAGALPGMEDAGEEDAGMDGDNGNGNGDGNGSGQAQ